MTAQIIVVEAAAAGERLDRFLAARGSWGSRAQVQRLIAAGHVRVDEAVVKAGTLLRVGQRISVVAVPAQLAPAEAAPEAIDLDILYEDDWILVIDKPPGLVVHPAPGNWRGTVVNALLNHWHGPRPGLDPARPGIVHRLDKDTSGVLVVAKDAITLADLAAQFRARKVTKQYVAFVWGRVRKDRGTIAARIGRHPVERKRMAVRPAGREAVTEFEVLERIDGVTLLRLFPHTGRTHQLRVHLAAIGHPIVGDKLYGHGGRPSVAGRQALHAEQLAFRHPRTGAAVAFRAPLPADMAGLRETLKRKSA
ncbi:RluA family pseudouridine synthase [Candidatus Binatia bacterium]|nr:RluA family pseudouridine synthase [Candidatus Binatia bacterium]